MQPLICCPRCGRQNPGRAKFCAGCGLNLQAAGVALDEHVRSTTGRTVRWLLLIMVVSGFILAALGVSRCQRHGGHLIEPEVYLDDGHRWHGNDVTLDPHSHLPARPKPQSGRIPTH